MTLADITPVAIYIGNGSADEFSFSFKVNSSDELEVYLIDTLTGAITQTLTYAIDYTVDAFGNDSGGTVTYPLSGSKLTDTNRIVIKRVTARTQELDVDAQRSINNSLEEQLDRMVAIIQEFGADFDRVLKAPYGTDPDSTFSFHRIPRKPVEPVTKRVSSRVRRTPRPRGRWGSRNG